MKIEAGIQQEIMKLDRFQQLGSGIDTVRGAETILANNEGKPFHTSVFDHEKGVIVFKAVDHTVITAMKGALLGIYRELRDEGSKGIADIIISKHT